MKRTVTAAYRPRAGNIALFVHDGDGGQSSSVVSVDEARAIHGALGVAISLAEKRGEPISAVPAGPAHADVPIGAVK